MPLLRENTALLRAYRRGDARALEAVYRHYVRSLDVHFRVLARTAGLPEFAQKSVTQDLLQEAFIRAFSAPARKAYDGLRDFGPYLKAIARNCFMDLLRKRKCEVALLAEAPSPRLALPMEAEWSFHPQVIATLESYLEGLPPVLKAVYEERFERGLSQEAACESLGLSRSVLRTKETHLRRGLRRALVQRGLFGTPDGPTAATAARSGV